MRPDPDGYGVQPDNLSRAALSESWLKEKTRDLSLEEGTDFGSTPWGKVLLNIARMELAGLREMAVKALSICREADGLDKYIPVLQKVLDQIVSMLHLVPEPESSDAPGIPEKPVWDKVFRLIQDIEFGRMPVLGKDADKAAQEKVKKLRDKVKAGIRKLKERVFTEDSGQIIKDLNLIYPKMKCLAGLATDLAKKYNEKKAKKSILDFNDLEHLCLEILNERNEDGSLIPSGTADPQALCGDCRRIPGQQPGAGNHHTNDIRTMWESPTYSWWEMSQSIYRFRQARPELSWKSTIPIRWMLKALTGRSAYRNQKPGFLTLKFPVRAVHVVARR